jgi:hypothetical protein
MSIIVFWIVDTPTESDYRSFFDNQLTDALKFAEVKRKEGFHHVTLSSEMTGSVGKPGVTSIEDGRTPDGEAYGWSKQHRGNPHLQPNTLVLKTS